MARRYAEGIGIAILLTMTGIAVAQNPTPAEPFPTSSSHIAVPDGYTAHHSVDLGGHMVNMAGSNAMYSTLVNLQSGPRVLGETFEMRALPGTKATFVDNLRAVGNGFGGDPNTFAKLDFSKAKNYEFSGLFRRDRQYFDYDLLGNPNLPAGMTLPIGPSNAPTGTFAWKQVQKSPELFNTVRRITDVNLIIKPQSKLTYRLGYSRNTFEGPSLSPAYNIMKYDGLLEEYQRNSTDDFTGAIEWKPVQNTKLAFEEQVHHYKADSYYTLDPTSYNAQESDGTKVYLGHWDALTAPYTIAACDTKAMGSGYTSATVYTMFTAPTLPNGLPTINAACSAVTSYMRSQPTRVLIPTEGLRLQSSSIKNLTMNGDMHYTLATMDLPHYYENAQGLDVVSATVAPVRTITYNGVAKAHRAVVGINYAAVWQVAPTFTIADQVSYSNVQQPGYSTLPIATTQSTSSLATGTIFYNGPFTTGNAVALPHGVNGVTTSNYFGQRSMVNNLTASWDASARARLSLTYRYGTRTISQGAIHNVDIPAGALTDPVSGNLTINQNGGIFNAALRPSSNWDINGTAEMFYDDNALTPVAPRQTQRYRVHTKFRPKPWATLSAGFNDTERHNNTYNNQASATPGAGYDGPINHQDHSRVISFGGVLAPNEHVGLDFNYAYSDVYTATNICYATGGAVGAPGAVTASGLACGGATAGSVSGMGPARDFMDAPTQYGSVALALTPVKKIHSDLGYRVSSVDGTQFFNDARQVNGSLESTYVSPFANVAWTVHNGLIWKAEYNYFGYGEGGATGAALCSTAAVSLTVPIVGTPCNSIATGTWATEGPQGASAPRNFHANNVTLGLHYEF
jgi:hypothetical protein